MQKLSTDLIGTKIVSVASGETLGTLEGIVIEPDTLKIIVFSVLPVLSKDHLYLLPRDIRFNHAHNLLVDSHQSLSDFDDLVRFQHAITQNYKLVGKKVVTSEGKKLGNVAGFMFDPAHYFVNKLQVTPNLFQRFMYSQLLIDRADIIETQKNQIIVKESRVKFKKASLSVLPAKSET